MVHVTNNFINLSKTLRKEQTPWEAKLWYLLRGNRLNGLKFKRQVPIGKFIADFCCDEKALIIELDGGQHNETRALEADIERSEFLKSEGYTVLRFWNNELDSNIDGVLEAIRRATSLPTSPHAWGEEKEGA